MTILETILSRPDGRPPVILCIGAHCDDVEIGCGGTILRCRERWPDADIRWMVLTENDTRRQELEASAELFLGPGGSDRVETASFRDGYLPYDGAAVKDFFESRKSAVRPDVIFTHTGDDRHQDHRLVRDLTWNTWRDHLILEYEVPKYDGDLGRPNLYVPLTEHQMRTKIAHMLAVYATQRDKDWFDEETFRGLMRLRGMESRAAGGYAEAFHARKLVLGL